MSTRSGKRIHSSFIESSVKICDQINTMSERKTRNRKHKENYEEDSGKIRENYVSYPTDDEDSKAGKTSRQLRKHTLLKEIYVENVKENGEEELPLVVRETRRTKRFINEDIQQDDPSVPNNLKAKKRKGGKSKKRKTSNDIEELTIEPVEFASQKKSKNKKKKRSSLLEIKEVEPAVLVNHSHDSIDSYSTAIGSPEKEEITTLKKNITPRAKELILNTKDNTPKNKEQNSIKVQTPQEKVQTPINKEPTIKIKELSSNTKEKTPKNIEQNLKHKEPTPTSKEKTFKNKDQTTPIKEQTPKIKELVSNKKKITPQLKTFDNCPQHNGVYNNTSPKLDSTFDKRSSLLSSDMSDGAVNVTFDKTNGSTISITSDDSKTSDENIINTTPLLIESSLDNSNLHVSTSSRRSSEPVVPLQRQGTFTKDEVNTTLQREGTFTKDGPDPIILLSPKNVTPRRGSLPAAGHTPYNSNAKKRQKSVNLNLTHSVEKPVNRRSSGAELVRQTKVMFCSPVNNSILSSLRKSRVIKSSMKGSNKSFVFDESLVTGSTAKTEPSRKRSLTHGDADERVKRARLTTELTNSVNRLSRPRTLSATVKSTQPKEPTTPTKKQNTPLQKPESVRSKLPNFAALHQRRFQKMESLDECQLRKARRAKQLMSPTGSLAVLKQKPAKVGESNQPAAKTPTKLKKMDKTPAATLPKSILDLKPGYTRFGFKVNYHVNPFSVPPKPSAVVPVLKSDNSQPPLKGGTLLRKAAAKQSVMRERPSNIVKDRRSEYRDMIKGVRTNRRFELQMRSRNINS